MFVQGVVDHEMRLLDIVTGWPRGMPISRQLKCSGFYKLCESRDRLNGKLKMSSKGEEIREYLLGSDSYALLPWLITPYEDNDLEIPALEFNQMHEAVRTPVVTAFSQLKGGWRILSKVMWRPDKRKLPFIILTCFLLHNIIIDCGDSLRPYVALSGHHGSDYAGQSRKHVDPIGTTMRENVSKHLWHLKEKASSAPTV